MSTYRFYNDITSECKITTAPVTAENLKYFCGSYEQGVNLNYAVNGVFDNGIQTINYTSQLTPYYANKGMCYNIDLVRVNRDNYEINTTDSSEKSYTRVIYLLSSHFSDTDSGNISTSNKSNFEVVTNIESLNKITLKVEGTTVQTKVDIKAGYIYGTNIDTHVTDLDGSGYMEIRPYFVTVKNSKTFIYRLSFFSSFELQGKSGYGEQPFSYNTAKYTSSVSKQSLYDGKQPSFIKDIDNTAYLQKYCVISNTRKAFSDIWTADEFINVSKTLTNSFGQSVTTENGAIDYGARITVTPTNFDDLLFYAQCGLYFNYDGTRYKPIIESGICTGYTTDMTRASDIDSWTDFNHTVPSPEDAETKYDRIDDMPLGYTSYGNSFVKYYEINNTQLASFATELSDLQDGISHIVSLKSFPVNIDNFVTLKNTERINIPADKSNPPKVQTQANKLQVFGYDYLIGSIHIDGYYGTTSKPNFLDYAPYTKLELYIPFCGFVDLPSACMYQTINVYLLGDVIDGSCTGVVKLNGQIVAQKAGVIGQSMCISVTDNATRDNAILQGLITATGQTLGLVTSGVSGNVGAFANGAISIASTATNTIAGMNSNYTRVNGMNSGKINNALPPNCFLIRYRPEKIETDNYAHTYGIPTDKKLTLTAGDGFTIVDNLNTDSITGATAGEREELKSFYRAGVIL